MYSVSVTLSVAATPPSYSPEADSSVRLVFDRSDLYGPGLADEDVMDSDHIGPYYEKKGNTLVLLLECRRGAAMSADKVSKALSHALSAIGIKKRDHARLIYHVTQSCRARTGHWIAPATVLVKVDHRLREGPPTAESAALPRKRKAVLPPSDAALSRKRKAVLPPSDGSAATGPMKTRRRFAKGNAGSLPVMNLAPEFDRVAADEKQKRPLPWRLSRRRVAAVRTAPPLVLD